MKYIYNLFLILVIFINCIYILIFQSTIEYIARKPSDFTVLINLVQIYSHIIDNLEFGIETSSLWLPYTINVIINHSLEHPTVSSLYKLLTIMFQKLDWYILENIKNNSYKENVIKYVNCVMEYVHTFKGDLQFCCFEMLLSLPSTIIKEIFNIQILDIVKVIIKICI